MGPFTVAGILKLMQAVGPSVARLPEFVQHFNQVKSTFKEKDQEVLQEAYRDLQAENSGGHARLQEKLRIAAEKE